MYNHIVAIIGRPNVGKSTLFNSLVGERISIVEDTPGVTRDRIYAPVTWLNKKFMLVDTGGLEPKSDDMMLKIMREQAQIAIDTADVIIFVTDVQTGMTDSDRDVADVLRRSHKPVVLCVNKVDSFKKYESDIYEFYNLGIGDIVGVSAASRLGIGDLLDAVCSHFSESEEIDEDYDEIPKIAIVGKPNVGKSSIINRLCGENRVIVSDVAGTTRDSIDTKVKHAGQEFIFIDTAGLRRKSKIKENIERYSIIRTVAAVERCDVCILVIDAGEGVTEQDAKIAGIAHDSGKGVIIAVNKWDAVEDKDAYTMNKVTGEIRDILSFMPYAEILYISAVTGQRLNRLFDLVETVIQNQNLRIQTGTLNQVLSDATVKQQPPSDKGKRLKIFYMTQVSIKPPTFVIFVNNKELMHYSYTRYIENQLREAFGFKGTSLKFIIRERGEEK
jgi:GTP-binding protein